MLSCQRHLFDIPRDVTYVNVAYLSPLMIAVRDAGYRGIDAKVHPWEIKWKHFYEDVERSRALFATLIGAAADDIAITAATSYGVATASQNLPLKRGQKIVALDGEHTSTIYEYKRRAKQDGGELVLVKKPADGNWTEAVLAAIDERTGWVGVPNCYWTDGGLIDLERVAERAHAIGAALIVDLTQTLGAKPFALDRVNPDYLVCSAYKWLMGPYSLGYLYAHPKRQNGRPLEQHSFSRAGADKAPAIRDYPEAFMQGARRFDVGERSNFINLPMANAAIEKLLDWTPEAITEYVRPLTDRVAEHAERRQLLTPPRQHRVAHMIGVRFPAGVPQGLMERLERSKVYISVRNDAMRISPHVYNTIDDIDRIFETLDEKL